MAMDFDAVVIVGEILKSGEEVAHYGAISPPHGLTSDHEPFPDQETCRAWVYSYVYMPGTGLLIPGLIVCMKYD